MKRADPSLVRLTTGFLDGTHPVVDAYELKVAYILFPTALYIFPVRIEWCTSVQGGIKCVANKTECSPTLCCETCCKILITISTNISVASTCCSSCACLYCTMRGCV